MQCSKRRGKKKTRPSCSEMQRRKMVILKNLGIELSIVPRLVSSNKFSFSVRVDLQQRIPFRLCST